MSKVFRFYLGRSFMFSCYFLTQEKLDKELEAVRAEQMRAAIQAAADRQLADAQQQVQGESKLVCSYQQSQSQLSQCFSAVRGCLKQYDHSTNSK